MILRLTQQQTGAMRAQAMFSRAATVLPSSVGKPLTPKPTYSWPSVLRRL